MWIKIQILWLNLIFTNGLVALVEGFLARLLSCPSRPSNTEGNRHDCSRGRNRCSQLGRFRAPSPGDRTRWMAKRMRLPWRHSLSNRSFWLTSGQTFRNHRTGFLTRLWLTWHRCSQNRRQSTDHTSHKCICRILRTLPTAKRWTWTTQPYQLKHQYSKAHTQDYYYKLGKLLA